jgi:hypothetical protein
MMMMTCDICSVFTHVSEGTSWQALNIVFLTRLGGGRGPIPNTAYIHGPTHGGKKHQGKQEVERRHTPLRVIFVPYLTQ